jgi:anaerobic ribonucleoside-triphosphate reductase activating protein
MKPTWIRGLSLLGGEPLDPNNIKCVTELVKQAKARYPEKDIWCYTGYKWEDVCELPILQYIDVLVDGKYIENERDITLRFRGSRNQRLINVSQSIKTKTIVLWDI